VRIKLISDEAMAELTRMADDLAASERQYDQWCARHGRRRGSLAMDRMFEADHTEALAMNERDGEASR
jgi:hypothetical protein